MNTDLIFGPVSRTCSSNISRALAIEDRSKIARLDLAENFIGVTSVGSLSKLPLESRKKVCTLCPIGDLHDSERKRMSIDLG